MLDLTARRPAVVLSPRELECLAGLSVGLSMKEIAGRLGISPFTVAAHLLKARRRTETRTNAQLVGIVGRKLSPARARFLRPELAYRDELAMQLGGRIEHRLPFGRADVATDTDVFEVEPATRWRKGAQQAVFYGAVSGLRPNLAVFDDMPVSPELATAIFDAITTSDALLGLRLWARDGSTWALVTSSPDKGWSPGAHPSLMGRNS